MPTIVGAFNCLLCLRKKFAETSCPFIQRGVRGESPRSFNLLDYAEVMLDNSGELTFHSAINKK